MGIHQFAAIVLLVLSASLSSNGQPAEIRRRYEHFLTQHVHGRITENTCDSAMRERHITQSGNNCKDVNTFIQANGNHVRAVCTGAGTRQAYNRDLYMSNNKYTVITCTLKSGERYPNCKYRGHESSRYIVVACEDGWPTHYDKGVIG